MSFELEPEELRRLGHAVVDLMVEAQSAESEDPVLPAVSGAEARERYAAGVPHQGAPLDSILDELRSDLLPLSRKNGHPRFFGYICASADPIGALADALASTFNQNVTAWRSAPAAAEMERQVVRWMGELTGFAADADGLLVSGGSAANTTAIGAALRSRPEQPFESTTVYRSREGHMSFAKACRALGVVEDRIRLIDVDGQRRMLPATLDAALTADRERGLHPGLVFITAGTANTGAIDPLDEIADICARHEVWLHIDGAYGAPAAMTADYAWMQSAFGRADSLSLDPHKWLFAPLDVGCVLFRDAEAARRAFGLQSEYVVVTQEDPIERFAFFDHGLELSRRNRALKVWMILKARGADAISDVIAGNIELRRYLDRRVAADERLEPLGSELGIACFRHVGGDDLNRHILETLNREGRFFLSPTTLEGRYALRVCITNFRTRRADIDLLVDEVLRIGAPG